MDGGLKWNGGDLTDLGTMQVLETRGISSEGPRIRKLGIAILRVSKARMHIYVRQDGKVPSSVVFPIIEDVCFVVQQPKSYSRNKKGLHRKVQVETDFRLPCFLSCC